MEYLSVNVALYFNSAVSLSSPDPPFHWIPLARLEKNRTRTPLLPEPTAMDVLYEQLKVTWTNTNSCRKTIQ